MMLPRHACFCFNRLEDKVRRVDLAVGVRVGDANHFATVLEDQELVDFRTAAEFDVLLLPDAQQGLDFRSLQLGQRKIVLGL